LAFLGDIGRFFLGGASTADVAPLAGSAIGGFFGGPSGAAIGSSIGSGIGQVIEGTADQPEQQSALPTPPSIRGGQTTGFIPQENAMSGSTMPTQAGFESLLPALSGLRNIGQRVGSFLGSPTGNALGIATGVGSLAFSQSGSSKMKTVLTQSRRNKSKVRQLVNFMGIEGTAQFLSQSIGRNVSPNDVVALLLRTFRNDGAFITKAQVRNLRRTTNRFKSLEKQVKDATSMTRTTRRAPVRRASSTTLIKN
jgi:hypothetical protein